jgi:uracil DNA glycosylase
MEVKIETSWKEVLNKEFKSTYFLQTAAHLKT